MYHTSLEKSREILSHCEDTFCTRAPRLAADLEDIESYRAAVEAQCAGCLEQETEMKDGETRVSCLEAENEVLRREIAAMKIEIAALQAALRQEVR